MLDSDWLPAEQSPPCFKTLKHLKQQTKLQCMLTINITFNWGTLVYGVYLSIIIIIKKQTNKQTKKQQNPVHGLLSYFLILWNQTYLCFWMYFSVLGCGRLSHSSPTPLRKNLLLTLRSKNTVRLVLEIWMLCKNVMTTIMYLLICLFSGLVYSASNIWSEIKTQ